MRLLKIGQLAILLILSKNAASQTDLLFKKVVPFDTLSMNGFVFWKDTTLITIQEIQFIKCSLIVPNLDSVIGYWGIRNDTIYYISDKSYRNDCTEFMPMIQLKEAKPKIWSVMENECSGYNKSIDFFRFSYSIRLLSKTSFNNDVVYTFKHTAANESIPSPHKKSMNEPANFFRVFSLSIDNGFYDFDCINKYCSMLEFIY